MTTSTTFIGLIIACIALPAVLAAEGQCIWYGECNVDERGFKQNCAYSGLPRNLTDDADRELFQQICPFLFSTAGDSLCCDGTQIRTMNDNLLKAAGIYSRCPSCLINMYTIFCETTCSPTQSDFMEVVESQTNENGKYITEINVYLTEDSSNNVFDSCKGVIMPQTGKYATDITCGAYDATSCNTARWFEYMGRGNPFDPFFINFLTTRGIFDDMDNRALHTVRCNESSSASAEACSCVDCADSCPASDDSMFKARKPFLIKVLGIDVYVLSSTIAYIIILLVTAYFVRKTGIYKKDRSSAEFLEESDDDNVFLTDSDEPKPSRLETWGYESEVFLESVFSKIGFVCASYPILVFLVGSWGLAVLIYGLPSIQLISKPVELWASPSSQSRQEKDYFDSRFGPFYRAEQIFVKAINLPEIVHEMPQGNVSFGPVFNKDFLLTVYELQMSIQELGRNRGIPLEKICFAPLHNDFTGPPTVEKCTIQTVWGYFQNSLEYFNREGMRNGLKTNYLNVIFDCLQNPYDPSCLAPYGGPSDSLLVAGGFLDDANKTIVQAGGLVLNFVVNNHLNDEDNADALAWEKLLIDFLLEWQRTKMPSTMEIGFMAERSIEDEIERVAVTSTSTILISYGLMLIYVAIALGRFSSWKRIVLDSKIVVAIAGTSSVLLSVLAALGIFSYFNYPTILLTIEAVPFLVLAVGVDNLFILVGTHERLLNLDANPNAKPSAQRMARTLGLAGPSMLLSTLSEEGCFLIGSLSDMPAVKSFAMLAATALGINFILQITVLMSVFALDERRTLGRRVDVLCCLRSNAAPAPSSRFVERLFENVLAPTLMNRWVRIVVPLVFVFLLLSTLPFLPRIEPGLDQSLAVTKDSYIAKYFQLMQELFSIGPPVYFIVTKGLNYTIPEHQNLVCGGVGCSPHSLAVAIQSASKSAELSHIARPASSWLDDLFDWTTLDTCCKVFANNGSFCPHDRQAPECVSCKVTQDNTTKRPSAADIRKYLPNFLTDIPDSNCAKGGIAAYAAGVNFVLDKYGMSDAGDSYFMAYHTPVRTSADYYEALRQARKVSAMVEKSINDELELEEPVKVFPYSIFYVYYEQYLTIAFDTVRWLLLSLVLLFSIMTLLNGLDFRASFIVGGITLAILMEMLAIMVLWSITLNAVSAVNLLVAMGIAVEFNAHVMHAFQKSTKIDRKARAKEALVNTGSQVFAGIFLTKFSGIAVLYFAPVQIMEVFYFRMYLSMVFLGAIHGLILLPVLLSYIGPPVNRARLSAMTAELRQTALMTSMESNS